MQNTMFDKYYLRMIEAIDTMNSHAKKGDLLRNHVNYGVAVTCGSVIRDMGHEVDTCVYGDGDFLVSAKIILDGEIVLDFEEEA